MSQGGIWIGYATTYRTGGDEAAARTLVREERAASHTVVCDAAETKRAFVDSDQGVSKGFTGSSFVIGACLSPSSRQPESCGTRPATRLGMLWDQSGSFASALARRRYRGYSTGLGTARHAVWAQHKLRVGSHRWIRN